MLTCDFGFCRFGFLKSMTKFFDNDLCLTKIKIDDKLKTIAFDEKNKRLTANFINMYYTVGIQSSENKQNLESTYCKYKINKISKMDNKQLNNNQ